MDSVLRLLTGLLCFPFLMDLLVLLVRKVYVGGDVKYIDASSFPGSNNDGISSAD